MQRVWSSYVLIGEWIGLFQFDGWIARRCHHVKMVGDVKQTISTHCFHGWIRPSIESGWHRCQTCFLHEMKDKVVFFTRKLDGEREITYGQHFALNDIFDARPVQDKQEDRDENQHHEERFTHQTWHQWTDARFLSLVGTVRRFFRMNCSRWEELAGMMNDETLNRTLTWSSMAAIIAAWSRMESNGMIWRWMGRKPAV